MNMQMKRHFFGPGNALRLSASLLLAVLAAGCAKEHPEPGRGGTVRLQVVGAALENPAGKPSAAAVPSTRAAEINGTFTFDHGDALGLFMRGTGYDDVDNRKVSYSKPGADAGTWSIAGDPIYLHDGTAVVSLVYPYADAAAYGNIPFTTGVYSPAKDLLWKQQDVYGAASQARVAEMKHALTRVKFIIKRDDPTDTSIPDRFTGAGAVSSVSIGDATAAKTVIYQSGKLDLSFTAPASPVSGVTAGMLQDETAFTLSATGHTTDFLMLPAETLEMTGYGALVGLYIRVDGQMLSTLLPAAAPADKWLAGTCYTYTVTVKNKEIKVTSSTITPWGAGYSGGGNMEVPTPPAVNDYYYSDGTTSTALNSSKTAEGIVFWVDPADPWHYKVVYKDEVDGIYPGNKLWSSSAFDVGTGDYAGIRAADPKDLDAPARVSGKANREILGRWLADPVANATGKTIADFPAFEYCDGLGEGWYLPAINELQHLCCAFNGNAPTTWIGKASFARNVEAQNAFGALFSAVGGTNVNTSYQASTEFSTTTYWYGAIHLLAAGSGNEKTGQCATRCIREILPPPAPPAVNDYYYSDGTTSKELVSGKTAEGIVFWVDPVNPMHYKVVSKNARSNVEWSWNFYDVGTGEYSGIRDGDSNGNVDSPARESGKANREILRLWMAADPSRRPMEGFPSFKSCDDMGAGWYLPAVNELQYLYCTYNGLAPVIWAKGNAAAVNESAQAAFNTRLTTAGGASFDTDSYWSSTEYDANNAWTVRLSNGETALRDNRDTNGILRCIKIVD